MIESIFDRRDRLVRKLAIDSNRLRPPILEEEGKLVRIVGLRLEVVGCSATPIGSLCLIGSTQACSGQQAKSAHLIEAEVVGFNDNRLLLVADGSLDGLQPGAPVRVMRGHGYAHVSNALIGRIIDGNGNPLDSGPAFNDLDLYPLRGGRINPLTRARVSQPLDVGVRSINALLTIGQGQRIGLFAGSGVGKTTLMGMMTRNTEADLVVIGLIGERGKEVRDFIETTLGEEGLKKAIVVATPADDSALRRIKGAWLATTIAEYFREKGLKVLLLMDSLTRVAQAQREIGLAVGEPPVTKGYTPSVFSLLPKLAERAGNGGSRGGSITAVYTVLTEGDDQMDPVADSARAILDGHIVLSRDLADSGVFPAIDIESSISRSMNQIVSSKQAQVALKFKQLYSDYYRNRDLISIGAYQAGSNISVDVAIQMIDSLREFISQGEKDPTTMELSLDRLDGIGGMIESLIRGAQPVQSSDGEDSHMMTSVDQPVESRNQLSTSQHI